MFIFVAAIVVIISVLITAVKPLWGTFASTACAATIGLKLGALYTLGQWPTLPEAAVLIFLVVLSYAILERKRKARMRAHPLYPLLEALESYQGDLERLATALEELAGDPEASAENPEEKGE